MIKLTIIFGGDSFEHEISILSLKSILKYIDKDKYTLKLIYIDKKGIWYECEDSLNMDNLKVIDNYNILKETDIVLPMLHGRYGEDGSIQGLFNMLKVKYVGCGMDSSLIAYDKELTKIVLNSINIPQAKYLCIKKDNYNIDSILSLIDKTIGYPLFIKPSRSGSSVGISKVYKKEDVMSYLREAFEYDNKVIIEEYIPGKEVEIAVLGNNNLIVSNIGQVKTFDDFYSYDAKYHNSNSQVVIPADVDDTLVYKIKAYAIEIYKYLGCRGLSRLDFFVDNDRIVFNEINTMPGFTNISMYPMLMDDIGINYSNLIDRLIELGLE